MSNYATLKQSIQSVIKTNGNQEITGAILQSTLLSIVDAIGADYLFAGVATPQTDAGSPDQNVFWIGGAGTYTNFGSTHTVKNGEIAVFSYNGSWTYTKLPLMDYAIMNDETIITYNGVTDWQELPKPLTKGLYVITWLNYASVNGTLMLSHSGNKTAYLITLKGSARQKNNFIYIPDDGYDCYACQVTGTSINLRKINESDISGNLISDEASHITSITQGYVNNAGNFVSWSNSDWLYMKISVTVGNYYLLPYSWMKGSVSPIVGLDSSDHIVKNYTIGNQQNKNGFIIFRADTPKIGLTYRALIGSIGGSVDLSDLISLPYWDLSANTTRGDWFFDFISAEHQLFTELFAFSLTEVTTYNSGYYNTNGTLITSSVGNWKHAEISVDAGSWYLINTNINQNTRIVDIDENNNTSVNSSVPVEYYNYGSNSNMSWVLVKAKYSKIGVSFDIPANNWNPVYRHAPKYTKIERTNNNGLILLFLQLYQIIGAETSNGKVFRVRKAGGADYTSFVEAVMDNLGKWNITLHVEEGTYDLLQELEDYYGTSNFLPLTPKGRGLELGYNIVIDAAPNAVFTANYTGSDTSMMSQFSPINCHKGAYSGGMTLRGVNIRCSNVRYCVHDEKGLEGVGSYNNIYENCNFYINNNDNTEWHSSQCIGGGLGKSGSIQIRNCIFEEIDTNSPTNAAVSYHNNAVAGAKSFISCVGNYIKGERGFRFSWYGVSTEITDIICCNNSVGRETQFRAETADSTVENMSLYEFNNIVRQ